jgi:hypothetical protein
VPPVRPGQPAVITVEVRNAGPGVAEGVNLDLLVSEPVTRVSATQGRCTVADTGTTVICRPGTVAPGATVTVKVGVVARDRLVTTFGRVLSLVPDPVGNDNAGRGVVPVLPFVDRPTG